MTHALTTHLGLNHLHTALLADNPSMPQTLILAADTLVVLNRSEYLSAEETITLRL
jgi:hypothetical protein